MNDKNTSEFIKLKKILHIVFYASFKFYDKDKRLIIQLHSYNSVTKKWNIFYVYNSISEGCLYRLLYLIKKDGSLVFYKGHDYVTETFIHMELQKSINEKIDSIPLHPFFSIDAIVNNPEISNIFKNYKSRYYKIDVLEPLKLCPSGYCFTNKFLDYIFGIKPLSIEDEKRIQPIIKDINKEQLDIFFGIFSSRKKEIIDISKEIGNTEKNALADYKTTVFIEQLNVYLDKYIDYDSISDFKYIFSNYCKILPNIIMYNNYYTFNVKIDDMPLSFKINDLYINDTSENILVVTNIIPHNPLPIKNVSNFSEIEISDFGLYDNILSCGILIYKILEYNTQTNILSSKFDTGIYSYIGEHLSKLNILLFIKEKYKDEFNTLSSST